MALLDGREQRMMFLTEDDFMVVLGRALEDDGGFRPDKSPRELMLGLNPNFLQGDFKVYVPLNGKLHHTEVEEDTGASMIECNTVIKLDHRMVIIACDGMFIELAGWDADNRVIGLRVVFDGNITRFVMDTFWDVQEDGQVPLHFAKTLNWQCEHIEQDGHAVLIEYWDSMDKTKVMNEAMDWMSQCRPS